MFDEIEPRYDYPPDGQLDEYAPDDQLSCLRDFLWENNKYWSRDTAEREASALIEWLYSHGFSVIPHTLVDVPTFMRLLDES